MPFYDFMCPNCSHLQEELQGMNDARTATCEACGSISRWSPTAPMIIGDTCAGNTSWTGYDPMLGTYLNGKGHRKEEMKRQGLEEFTPDPAMQSARDEGKYVRSHAPDRDPEARAASSGIMREADRKSRDAMIDGNKALDKALDKAVAEVSNSAG